MPEGSSENATRRASGKGRARHRTPPRRKGRCCTPRRRALPVCLLLPAILVLSARPAAGLEGEVGLEATWTDNLYQTASTREDVVTAPFGYLEAGVTEDLALRYELNGYLYHTNSELDSVWQRAALRYEAELGSRHDLEAELAYSGSLHASDTSNLDHHQVGATLELNMRPFSRTLFVPGLRAAWRTYPHASDLDHVEAIGSLLFNRSLETRTTLRLGGTLYLRRFLESASPIPAGTETIETPATDGDPSSPLAMSTTTGAERTGRGKGSGGPGGRWNGSGDGAQGPPAGETIEGNLDSTSVGQFLATLRVAQSVGSRVGIFVEGTYRTNFLDPPRYAEGSIPDADREFFDDHYGYEGPGANVQCSVLLPFGTRLELSGTAEQRRYVGRQALDLEGVPKGRERRDDRYEVGVRADYARDLERRFPSGLFAELGFVRVWNDSNDDWYDTEENRVFASFSLHW